VCVREPGSCPQTGHLNCFGTSRVKKQDHSAIYEDKRGFQDEPGVSHLKPDGYTQHPVIKRTGVRYRQMPLMKKFFRVGQVWSGVVWTEKLLVKCWFMCVCVYVVRWFFCHHQVKAKSTNPEAWIPYKKMKAQNKNLSKIHWNYKIFKLTSYI
jgi:hypothetical protein